MWLFTRIGFFSIVEKPKGTFHIRARARKDLENLNVLLGAEHGHVVHKSEDGDYRWRMVVRRPDAMKAICALAEDIDYSNFKNEVAATPGQRDKLAILHHIWSLMAQYQEQ